MKRRSPRGSEPLRSAEGHAVSACAWRSEYRSKDRANEVWAKSVAITAFTVLSHERDLSRMKTIAGKPFRSRDFDV